MTATSLSIIPRHAFAENQPIRSAGDSGIQQPSAAQLSLAREFVNRISAGFKKADQRLGPTPKSDSDASNLPEGEILLFQVRLPKKLKLDIPLMGQVRNKQIVLSFRDFLTTLDFPIEFDPDKGTATGWYIRQNKTFSLNLANRTVQSDQGTFNIPSDVEIEDGDLFVSVPELQSWFGIKIKPVTNSLDLFVESTIPLPIEEKIARQNLKLKNNRASKPQLPTVADSRQAIDFPFIDVATTSRYNRPGDGGDSTNRHTASVRTTGDLAYGTLSTQAQLDKEEKLTSFRANYKRESIEPELLGAINARRYELGDLTTVRMPIGTSAQEQGVRITNISPNRNFLRPSTEITGNTFPGWDVELYRDDQLISFQAVGDDGVYRFTDVDLFGSDNNFRVVQYGPQGEVQEETLYIPVDASRLSNMGSAYDVSVTRQNVQTYNKNDTKTEDEGSVHFNALLEQPVGKNTAVTAGLESIQRDSEQISTLHAGASTTIADTLLNLNTAIDSKGETAAELVARRNFGRHRLRNELEVYSDRYELREDDLERDILRESFSIEGPLPFANENTSSYNFSADYADTSANNSFLGARAGINTNWGRVSVGQSFDYGLNKFNQGGSQDSLHSIITASGAYQGYRFRLLSDYEIKPESNLDRVALGVQRRVTPTLEVGADLERRIDPDLTTASTYVNWDTGYGRLSPALSYNSDNDVIATLNTRFGIARNPQTGKIRSYDTQNTSNGGVSAFVYLDKNGDFIFNNDDEALPEVVVAAPQNGGRTETDENGYAFLKRMHPYRLTDVIVDRSSLQDPAWIPAFEGASIIPREGYVESMQFPIHMSGEIDGTVYARKSDGTKEALRSAALTLYNTQTGKVMSTVSESDGFYLFSQVPPGNYYLNIDGSSLRKKDLRQPLPQAITIGYEGTTIYGNEVILVDGQKNIPISIISDAGQIAGNPEALEGRTLVLNLGSYKSRMLMGLTWFKIRTEFSSLMKQANILERPSESYAAVKTGQHTLRVSLATNDINIAHQICARLAQRDIVCSIEMISAPPQKIAAAILPD